MIDLQGLVTVRFSKPMDIPVEFQNFTDKIMLLSIYPQKEIEFTWKITSFNPT